jgi:hypothetical protein
MTSLLLRLITELLEETTATTSALDGPVLRPRVTVMVARVMNVVAPRRNASERENTRRPKNSWFALGTMAGMGIYRNLERAPIESCGAIERLRNCVPHDIPPAQAVISSVARCTDSPNDRRGRETD